MLTILQTVNAHTQDGVIATSEFKIVYVAPMKALAAEITAKFSSRLPLVVRELTGDMQLTKAEISETNILFVVSHLGL